MIKSRLSSLHIIFWLLKDTFWCLGWTPGAVIMLFPTLILTVIMLAKDKENKVENVLLTCWIVMNCFWMSHELLNTPFWLVYPPMFAGISLIYKILSNTFKNI